MPLKNLFRSVKRYDVSTRNAYVVCIHLLNGSLIECTLTSDSTGQECLQNIAQRINLNEVSTIQNSTVRLPVEICIYVLFKAVYHFCL